MVENGSSYSSDDDGQDYDPTLPEDIDTDVKENTPQFTQSEQIKSQRILEKQVKLKNEIPTNTKLFDYLEDKTQEALKTYIDLEDTIYSNRQIGDSGQNGEYMGCVCTEEYEDGINAACFDDDCINRGTKIECVNGHSSCGDNCANQRFQKKQFAPINVIQTEKKGYGVRIQEDIEPDSFIYEYIGEVIDEKTFKKRMINYDKEGIKHFYFMMLQKGEFIDATQKGSLGRFLNHSCNPNCYVEKWVVGDKLKMGIFSKRKILANEELTFNYNVDRYGANAQQCFCGESNCIGFIGGKTQTESASLLPQFISEALGSSIEDEQDFILAKQKSSAKIEKNENSINVEFVKSLVMKEIEIFEINKVMGVLMQTDDYLIVDRLLERIEISKNHATQHKLSLAHGYRSFGKLINKYIQKNDGDEVNHENIVLISRILKIMESWPKVSKNHIEKVEIVPIIEKLRDLDFNNEISRSCTDLLDKWSRFEFVERIKKSNKVESEAPNLFLDDRRRERQQNQNSPIRSTPSDINAEYQMTEYFTEEDANRNLAPGWASAFDDGQKKYYFYNKETNETRWDKPERSSSLVTPKTDAAGTSIQSVVGNGLRDITTIPNYNPNFVNFTDEEKEEYRRKREREDRKRKEHAVLMNKKKQESSIQDIIRKAKELEDRKQQEKDKLEAVEAEKRIKKEQYKQKMLAQKKKQKERSEASKQATQTPSSLDPLEMQWKAFFAQHVPNLVKKHSQNITKDEIKMCSKDVVSTLAAKETKKGKSPPPRLESDKYKKVKAFVSGYMDKVIEKRENRQKRKIEEGSDSNGKKQHS